MTKAIVTLTLVNGKEEQKEVCFKRRVDAEALKKQLHNSRFLPKAIRSCTVELVDVP